MNARAFGVALALATALLLLAPLADAKTLPVGDSTQRTFDAGTITTFAWSYNFDQTNFNLVDGSQPNAVHSFAQAVTFDVSSAPGGFWTATLGGTWLGNVFSVAPPPTRSYVTTILWNGSAWLNMTTTFTLGGGQYTSPFAWQVCNQVNYVSGGTNYGANKECDRRYWGGNPTRIQHTAKLGNITMNGQNLTAWRVTFTGSHVADQTFQSLDLFIPAANAPNWTFSMSSTAAAVSGDLAHVTIDYLAETNSNYAAIEAGAATPTCDAFDCVVIKAADGIFGAMDHVLVLVFDRIGPAGQAGHETAARTADAISTGAALLIGIPTTLVALFLSHPGRSFIAWSDMLLILGIVRFASSPMSDVSVIWQTVLRFWTLVGKGMLVFAKFLYETSVKLFTAFLDAGPIVQLLIGSTVLGFGIGYLIHKLVGGG